MIQIKAFVHPLSCSKPRGFSATFQFKSQISWSQPELRCARAPLSLPRAPAAPLCGCGSDLVPRSEPGRPYLLRALEADPAAGGGDARLAAAVGGRRLRLADAAPRRSVLAASVPAAAARLPAARALLPGLRTSLGTVLAGVAAAGGRSRLCAHGEMTSGDEIA